MNPLGPGALAIVAIEWLAVGWLSGVSWPTHAPWGPRWALRLVIGACLVSAAQLALAWIGLGMGSIPAVLAASAVIGVTLRAALRPSSTDSNDAPPTTRRERIGWWLLALVLVAATVRSFAVPESGWDAFSHWGLRAQAYAISGTIVNAHSEHEYYPPLVPLLEAWLYAHRGGVDIDLGKTVWAVVGSAFGVCLTWHLRLSLPVTRLWLAPWLAVGVVLSTPALFEGFWTGQADLALTAFLTLAALAIVQWQRAPNAGWILQAGVFAAAAALTKFEGAPRVGVLVAAVLLEAACMRNRAYLLPAVLLFGTAGLATLVWTAFELTHGITPNAEHIGQLQPLALGSVVVALAAVFGGVRAGGGVLVAALGWIAAARQLRCPPLRLMALIVAGQFVATLAAFLLSSTSPDLEVRTSAPRLFEQFVPLALFVCAVGLCNETATYNRHGR